MGWTRKPRRASARKNHRPDLEFLEIRSLLNASPLSIGTPTPVDSTISGSGTNYDAIIGASTARGTYHVNGTGMTVAVIDAGVNYNNQALGNGFGPGHKVVAGFDFTTNSADPIATTAQHGTAVAGLIASSDSSHPGVAPGADIVALRVFDNSDQGSFDTIANALQWVIDNHDKYNITVVNLSLSDGHNYTGNWFANDGGVGQRMTQLIGKLDALNIPVVSAAGNSYSGQQGQGFPSIVPDTISVTSTDATDHIVSNAQRLGTTLGGASATDVAAPGEGLTAPVDGNNFAEVTGTSFSTPLVSGAVVLLQQVYESRFGQLPTVSQVDSWLQSGSDPINDPATGLTIGRLDIPKAISEIPNPAAQVLVPPTTTTTTAPVTTTSTTTTSTTSTSSSTATTATPAPDTSTMNLWLNGQQVTQSDLQNPTGRLTGLPSLFIQALRSLKNWWSGSDSSTTRVRVWTAANQIGSSQAAGTIKAIKLASQAKAVATASTTSSASAASSVKVMPRAWQSFAARSRTR